MRWEPQILIQARVALLSLVFLGLCAPALGEERTFEDLPQVYRDFIEREQTMNSTRDGDITTKVKAEYLPESRNVLKIPYVEIPVSDLTVVDSGLEAKDIRDQAFVERDGKLHLRFFIHPESEKLYTPLIKKYGIKGHFSAAPTASVRSMLMWDPHSKKPPFFGKLTLDREQDVLGRAISDWEVRRSIGITKLGQETSDKTWKRNKTTLIPEVFGAYVPAEYKMGSFIDMNQGTIFQHGLIFRDASFIEDGNVFPAFSLLSEREGGKEPLLVEWWKESGMSWRDFIKKRFFRPLADSVNYMSMVEGLHPDFHLQNFLVRIDPRTKRIVEIYHRDLGSFKVDMRMRAARGRSNEALRTQNPFYDFKPQWGTELYGKTLISWCWECNFINRFSNFQEGYKILKRHVPNYDPDVVLRVVEEVLREDVKKHWKLKPGKAKSQGDFSALAEEYIASRVKVVTPENASPEEAAKVRAYIQRQKKDKQVIDLPQWQLDPSFKGEHYRITPDGVIFSTRSWWGLGPRKAKLALYRTEGGPDDIGKEAPAQPATSFLGRCVAGFRKLFGGKPTPVPRP